MMEGLRAIFNLDNNTSLEFLHHQNNQQKTVLVIDKSRFLICKQLLMQNADDEEFASLLDIPISKVRFFKYKMQIWENNLRARRRAAKLNAKRLRNNDNKREVSPENRYKKARELIARKYSTNEISKILKISERSVTRFKKRMREEKHKLIANGKLILDSNDEDTSYKYLNEQEKLKKAKSLFEKNLSFAQVAEICRVSERTARRWRNRLANFDSVPDNEDDDDPVPPTPTQSNDTKPKRQRRLYYDREKIKYAIELMENGLSNKEISMLLELSIANVRKLKVNILNGTVNDLIDDSEDHYSKVMVIDDPLDGVDGTQLPIAYSSRRKPKKNLTVREMHITRLLRERGLRTMDIAKMVGISERSVTRLISKSKEYHVHEYGIDVLEEVEKLLSCKEQILNGELVDLDKITVKLESAIPEIEINEDIINDELIKEDEMIIEDNKIDIVDEIVPEPDTATSFEQNFISKSRIGMDLIKMNVKTADIAKMLDVSVKQIQKWRKAVATNSEMSTVKFEDSSME